jgi:mono/diheme cytochrome c family protein
VREAPAESAIGDPDRGREIFRTNCATCHGATGVEGGVGPSLRGESARKDDEATIAWIEHPLPPMPTLYPSPLTRDEVSDVAAYVQRL